MDICEIQPCSHCGAIRKGNVYRNKIWLCRKHYDQKRKYGYFLDKISNSITDKNEFIFKNNECQIVLKNKNHETVGIAIIDFDDFEKCSLYKWYLDSSGYASTHIDKNTKIRLHRFLINVNPNDVIDRINRNRLDCRKSNLRIVTYQENAINKGIQSNNTSGTPGVHFHNGLWIARLKCGNINLYSSFKNKNDAINQRHIWENEYFKENNPA